MLIGIKKNRGGIPMVGGSAFHFVKVLFNGKLPNLKMIKKNKVGQRTQKQDGTQHAFS